MCDTLGKIVSGKLALFAKNSDRSPNEPQVSEYRQAMEHSAKTLCATYIEIEQAPHTYATLLSRPIWMWGAEMGVNECGVCIGNEAVFTTGKYAKSGLTGMDMVRLGLERGATAKETTAIIIELLERYGQGGNCGYDHDFFYDNAFLIMDRQAIYLLETAGKAWVYKQVKSGGISNRLSIGTDGDVYSGGTAYDFTGRHLEPIYSCFSGSKKRLAQTKGCLASGKNALAMMAVLRAHRDGAANHLTGADVASPCMHAGGLVGDHTTASMVVELGDEITVWLTGSSTPCISLFKPWMFGNTSLPPVFTNGRVADAARYWREREAFHRKVIGQVLHDAFYDEMAALESKWFAMANGANAAQMASLSQQAIRQEEAFLHKWMQTELPAPQGKRGYLRYWQKKTVALETSGRGAVGGDSG